MKVLLLFTKIKRQNLLEIFNKENVYPTIIVTPKEREKYDKLLTTTDSIY